jgi:hypothetical protein
MLERGRESNPKRLDLLDEVREQVLVKLIENGMGE